MAPELVPLPAFRPLCQKARCYPRIIDADEEFLKQEPTFFGLAAGIVKTTTHSIARRQFLATSSAALGLGFGSWNTSFATHPSKTKPEPKSVAAIVTIYRKNSHADVLVGKILEGWKQDGGTGPALKLSSLYVDQFPADDMSVALAAKHGFRLCKSIREAIELDSGTVAVEGVLSIGEHGDYPRNEKGQQLYPRRRFFDEIASTFEKFGKVVPVFNDKHPGPVWEDAKWMADRAHQLNIPWMAGSSLPVSYRDPDIDFPKGENLEACVGIGYSGLDIYGFHTLEFLQCLIEKRASPTTGVEWVQAYTVSSIPELLEQKKIDRDLLEAGLASSGTSLKSVLASTEKESESGVFLIQYLDGLLAPVIMVPGIATGISAACRLGNSKSFVTRAEERPEPSYPHFAYLLKAIEQMIHTGKPTYPVERSILTSGILDRALTSKHLGNQRIETPELNIHYIPSKFSFAPHIDLDRY